MPHSFGYRARTRSLFAKKFGEPNTIPITRFQTVYKIGDIVDVKGDGSSHKGMPHKFYHGRTGVVWSVTRRAIGVVINKQVNGRIIPKRIHVRIEHVRKSHCRDDYIAYKRKMKKEVKKAIKNHLPLPVRKLPEQPPSARFVSVDKPIRTVYPRPFVWSA